MRVIAGSAKGRKLEAPKGLRVRPTLERVREALFDILAPRIPGARFLDLFAGTGANGIEALSRGAAFCSLVDNDPQSLAVIRRNLAATALGDRAECRKLFLLKDLVARLGVNTPPFDIIYADPPYVFHEHEQLLGCIRQARLLAANGFVIVEHSARKPLPRSLAGYQCHRVARYGETCLTFYLDAPQEV